MKTSNHLVIERYVQQVVKYSVSVVAVLYLIGFVVTTSHLAHYHITTFTLIKPQYILAGFWAALPIGIALLLLESIRKASDKEVRGPNESPSALSLPPQSRSKKLLVLRFFLVSLGYFILALFSLGVLDGAVHLLSGATLFFCESSIIAILGTVAFSTYIQVLWYYVTEFRKSLDLVHSSPQSAKSIGIFIRAVPFMLIYLVFFGDIFYTHIPTGVGGGEPKKVVFLLKGDTHLSNSNAPPVLGETPGYSRMYLMLLETEKDFYVIEISDKDEGQVISFPRDLVNGYIMTVKNSLVSKFRPFSVLPSSASDAKSTTKSADTASTGRSTSPP
jgi:hypothetical protein